MSDGFYDVKGRKVPEPASGGAAPARKEPEAQRPRNVRQALSSLSEPGYQNSLSDAGYLHNSLSGEDEAQHLVQREGESL